MLNDHDRMASLFTPDGAVRIPSGNLVAIGPDEIRAMGEAAPRVCRHSCSYLRDPLCASPLARTRLFGKHVRTSARALTNQVDAAATMNGVNFAR